MLRAGEAMWVQRKAGTAGAQGDNGAEGGKESVQEKGEEKSAGGARGAVLQGGRLRLVLLPLELLLQGSR